MRIVLASLILPLALTASSGGIKQTRTVVNDEYFQFVYQYKLDAGISTGFWGAENRAPGEPEFTNKLAQTGESYHSYGLDIYSHASLTLLFEFFDSYYV